MSIDRVNSTYAICIYSYLLLLLLLLLCLYTALVALTIATFVLLIGGAFGKLKQGLLFCNEF